VGDSRSLGRRTFVAGVASSAVIACADRSTAAPRRHDLDDSYRLLEPYAPGAVRDGGISHAPMVAEALSVLGLSRAFPAWLEGYDRRRTLEPKRPATPLSRPRAALGRERDPNRWSVTFRNQLARLGWRPMLRQWLPRLLPGAPGGAAHGLIRTGHAARALERKDTPERQTEVADALGLWAAWYQPLPGTPSDQPMQRLPSVALRDVPPLARSLRGRGIGDSFARLHKQGTFARVIDLASPGDDVVGFLHDLIELGSRLYLANAGGRTIAWCHAVTAPTTTLALARYLSPADQRRAARYAWQVVAALHASFSPPAVNLDRVGRGAALTPATALPAAALENGDEHVIKLVEACLRAHRRTGDKLYLAAASDVSKRL